MDEEFLDGRLQKRTRLENDLVRVPTPFTAKRTLDADNLEDNLEDNSQKRVRLAQCPASTADAVPCGLYMNNLLQKLHFEKLARRQSSENVGSASANSFSRPLDPEANTQFSLADLVQCGHASWGRCLQCSGQQIQNVPLATYSAFCRAYGTSCLKASSETLTAHTCFCAPELSFAAFASLVAILSPSPGERFLHLGSGSGRAVLAWSVLFPQSEACGVEASIALHQEAVAAVNQLDATVQQRIRLHYGDPLSMQANWSEASVILVSLAAMEHSIHSANVSRTMQWLTEGMHTAAPGTRVVSLSQPLCSNPGGAPIGFIFDREVAYRTTGTGNCTAFIYRKLEQEA